MDLNFINTLHFDNRNTKLVGWGKEKFIVLSIATSKATIYEIQQQLFEEILSLTYKTYETNERDECILTCKSTGKLQVIIYDYFDSGGAGD